MRTLFIALCLILCLPLVAAQDAALPELPIVFHGRGLALLDAATGELSTWDDCGDSQDMVISPTGERLIYSDYESSLVLCDFATGDVTILAAWDDDSLKAVASRPAWSPDGSTFAWVVQFETEMHLYVYDPATQVRRVIRQDLPVPDLRPTLLWGVNGIIVALDSPDEAKRFAALYSPEGALINDELADYQYPTAYFLVTDADGREFLGRSSMLYANVIDPMTGEVLFPEQIEMYSVFAPEGLTIAVNYDSTGTWVYLPDGTSFTVNSLGDYFSNFVPYLTYDVRNLGIAPDGLSFVVFDIGRGLWREGVLGELPEGVPGGDGAFVLWGPVAYRLRGELMSGAG